METPVIANLDPQIKQELLNEFDPQGQAWRAARSATNQNHAPAELADDIPRLVSLTEQRSQIQTAPPQMLGLHDVPAMNAKAEETQQIRF